MENKEAHNCKQRECYELLKTHFRLNEKCELERKNKASGIWRIVKLTYKSMHGYYRVTINKRGYFYHRIIWCLYYEKDIPQSFVIDHIDGNRTNNNINNLRLATSSQNVMNRKPARGKLYTPLKGVSYEHDRNKYVACIRVNNMRKRLGRYNTPEEAHAAYCEASKKYHGEFGRTE